MAGLSLTHEERVALTFIAHNDPRDGFVRRTWLEFKTAICGLLQRTRTSGWVAVSERLPEEYETVLVATNGSVSAGEIRFPDSECGMDEPWWMVFKDKRDRSAAWAGLVPLNDVTHWMPLPGPPGG